MGNKISYSAQFNTRKSDYRDSSGIIKKSNHQIHLPSNIKQFSSLYRIKTSEKFTNCVELHIEHDTALCGEQLTFLCSKDTVPPYKFELCKAENQEFISNNTGKLFIRVFMDSYWLVS